MGTPVQRSIRLIGKTAESLDKILGEPGEIFLDTTSNTLRILNANTAGGTSLATPAMVTSMLGDFSGSINTTGTIESAGFIGNLSGNASTVTDGVYTTGSYDNPTWITGLDGNKITGAVSSVTNGVYTTDTGTVTNLMLVNNKVTFGTTEAILGATVTTIAGLSSVSSTSFTGALTGNATTATTLATARNINGVAFDGSSDITITANANTVTGTTLKSTVVNSNLTSVGTLTNLSVAGAVTVNNDITANSNIVVSTLPTSTTHATNKKYVDTRALAMSIAMG
jgi:hypothetical protein